MACAPQPPRRPQQTDPPAPPETCNKTDLSTQDTGPATAAGLPPRPSHGLPPPTPRIHHRLCVVVRAIDGNLSVGMCDVCVHTEDNICRRTHAQGQHTYVSMCVCIHVFAGECQDQEGQGASGGRGNCDRTAQDSQRRRPPIIRGPLGLVCSLIHFMISGHESQSSPARRHAQRRRPRNMILKKNMPFEAPSSC